MYKEDYEKVKTPKELYELIKAEFKWIDITGGSLSGGLSSECLGGDSFAYLAAIRIRAENLTLDIPPVGGDLRNWCIDAQKIMDKATLPKADTATNADTKLCAALALYVIEGGAKKPTILSLTRIAKVARTTAYNCPHFRSVYESAYGQSTKKRRRYRTQEMKQEP